MQPSGHLFVVHGLIEHLVHDAAVVPVDAALDFNPYWKPLLGEFPSEPTTWHEGWGRVGETNWLVEIGDGDYGKVLGRLATVLEDISRDERSVAGDRLVPLVAVPVLGIGLGGHRHEQGHVLQQLIAFADRWVRKHPVDIALVTPEASVYAAAQFARGGP